MGPAALVGALPSLTPNLSAVTIALPSWTQLAAVAVGAVGGAAYAARRGFDVVGVLSLAVAAGLGGLLLRDTLLQNGTSIVLLDGRYLLMAVAAAAVGFFFAGLIDRLEPVLLALDALALGFFCTVGADSALSMSLSPVVALFIGTVTATGGIVLRDVLAGDAPRVMRPGVFIAAAAFLGASTFVLLVEATDVPSQVAQIVAMLVVFVVRLLAVRLAWRTRPAQDLTDRLWGLWSRHDDEVAS